MPSIALKKTQNTHKTTKKDKQLQTFAGKMNTRVRHDGQNSDKILTACCVFLTFIASLKDVGTLHIVRFKVEAIEKITEKAVVHSLRISELEDT